MNDKEPIHALRPMVIRDKFQCLGCGYEHQCGTHGCAILKQALERLEQLTAPEANPPLTLEELREIAKESPLLCGLYTVMMADRITESGRCFFRRKICSLATALREVQKITERRLWPTAASRRRQTYDRDCRIQAGGY